MTPQNSSKYGDFWVVAPPSADSFPQGEQAAHISQNRAHRGPLASLRWATDCHRRCWVEECHTGRFPHHSLSTDVLPLSQVRRSVALSTTLSTNDGLTAPSRYQAPSACQRLCQSDDRSGTRLAQGSLRSGSQVSAPSRSQGDLGSSQSNSIQQELQDRRQTGGRLRFPPCFRPVQLG